MSNEYETRLIFLTVHSLTRGNGHTIPIEREWEDENEILITKSTQRNNNIGIVDPDIKMLSAQLNKQVAYTLLQMAIGAAVFSPFVSFYLRANCARGKIDWENGALQWMGDWMRMSNWLRKTLLASRFQAKIFFWLMPISEALPRRIETQHSHHSKLILPLPLCAYWILNLALFEQTHIIICRLFYSLMQSI